MKQGGHQADLVRSPVWSSCSWNCEECEQSMGGVSGILPDDPFFLKIIFNTTQSRCPQQQECVTQWWTGQSSLPAVMLSCLRRIRFCSRQWFNRSECCLWSTCRNSWGLVCTCWLSSGFLGSKGAVALIHLSPMRFWLTMWRFQWRELKEKSQWGSCLLYLMSHRWCVEGCELTHFF